MNRPGGEFREETSIAGQTTRNPAGRQMREGIHQAGVPTHEPLPARAPVPTVAVATPATEETMENLATKIAALQIVVMELMRIERDEYGLDPRKLMNRLASTMDRQMTRFRIDPERRLDLEREIQLLCQGQLE